MLMESGLAKQGEKLPGSIRSAQQVAILGRLSHPEGDTRHAAGNCAGDPLSAGAGNEALVEFFEFGVTQRQRHDAFLLLRACGVEEAKAAVHYAGMMRGQGLDLGDRKDCRSRGPGDA